MSKQFIRQVDTVVIDKMFGQKYGPRKLTLEKNARREVSSPESETGRKGSKSGAPDEIGRYHMYACDPSLELFQRDGKLRKKIPKLSYMEISLLSKHTVLMLFFTVTS